MKTIEVTISPSGESRIETIGFVGSECRQASRFLEAALGRRSCESLKAEFHEVSFRNQTHLEQKS